MNSLVEAADPNRPVCHHCDGAQRNFYRGIHNGRYLCPHEEAKLASLPGKYRYPPGGGAGGGAGGSGAGSGKTMAWGNKMVNGN